MFRRTLLETLWCAAVGTVGFIGAHVTVLARMALFTLVVMSVFVVVSNLYNSFAKRANDRVEPSTRGGK